MPRETIRQIRAITLAALMICSVFAMSIAFGGAAAASTDNTSNGDLTIQESGPSFAENSSFRQVARGDNLREPYTEMDGHTMRPFEINFGSASTVTIAIDPGSSSRDYQGSITLEDDGSGQAKLFINTWEMGHTNPFEVEGASIDNWNQIEFDDDSQLVDKTKEDDQDGYQLFLGEGSSPEEIRDSFADVATLRVEEAETESYDILTAPQGFEMDEPSDVWDRPHVYADPVDGLSDEVQTGDYQNPAPVAKGDTMIFAPVGSGYYGPFEHALDETDGDAEDAFLWLVENGYYELTFHQLDNEDGTRVFTVDWAKVLDLEQAIEQGDFQVINTERSYHITFALDMGTNAWESEAQGGDLEANPGDKFVVDFGKQGRVDQATQRDHLTDGAVIERYSPIISEWFEITEPNAWVDPLPTGGASEGTISGATTLSPGTELSVTVEAGGTVTETTTTVTRQYDGHGDAKWNVTADLSDAESSNDIRVEVAADNLDPKWVDVREQPEEELPPEEKIAQLNEEIEDLEDQLEGYEQLQEEAAELESDLNETETERDSLQEKVSSYEDQISSLEEKKTELEEQVSDLEGQLEDDTNEDDTNGDDTNEDDTNGDDEDGDSSDGDEGMPGFGVGIALVALLSTAGLAIRNRA